MRRETGDYEPLFTLESWRVIVEQRADGKVETEATIKIWVDGERYVRTAEGNGPVNALDAALRAAIARDPPAPRATSSSSTTRSASSTRRHGTGAVTRVLIDASDGHDVWGSIGVARERHRRLVAGARRLAGVRRAARRRRRAPGATGPAARGVSARPPGGDPARAAGPRRGRGAARSLEVLRSGQLSLGPRVPGLRGGVRGARSASPHASAVSSGTAGLHLALRAVGVTRRRRGRHVAVLVRRQRERRASSSARGRCSPTSTR